ncbi:FeoB-associated Cys-rich membrane protein [Chishuiella sp.]|nr:FeoB-associated Cys-rich membrane protein [Chishuiella sp.]
MDNVWVQYAFIAFLFGFAVWYVVKMVKKSFSSGSNGGCSKGCGCSTDKK